MSEVEKVLRDIADYHDNEGSHWKANRCREAATLLTALQARNEQLDADCDRWINAYKIAVDQAMANGSRAIQLEAQLAEARALVPPDARKLAGQMLVGYGFPASCYAADAGLTEKRTRELLAAFRALGWAECGPFHCEDDNLIRGSGTWLTPAGDALRAIAPGCEQQTGPIGDAGQ